MINNDGYIKMNRRRRGSPGFTLVEAVVMMFLMAVLFLSLTTLLNPAANLWSQQTFRQGPLFEARLALMRMSRDINQIRNAQSIVSASNQAITITNTANQNVAFDMNGQSLERNNAVLLDNVTSFQLDYWDINNNAVVTPQVSPNDTDIYRVGITLTVQVSGKTATLRTQVRPRNINL